MKQLFYLILYLNIYTSLSGGLNAQNLHLKINSNKATNSSTLDSLNYLKEFKNFKLLSKEVDTISFQLNRLGYINHFVDKITKLNDSTFFTNIEFGKKFTQIKVFYDEHEFSEKDLNQISSKYTSTYFIIPFNKIEASLSKLNLSKIENGHPFAQVQLNYISTEEDQTLTAHLNYQEGSNRTIDKIIIKGYDKFPTSYIRYYSGLRKGDVFSQKKISKQSEILNTLGFTDVIKPPEALFKKDSTFIYLYLKKKNNNLFDGILGFSSDEESSKLIFNGYLNLELNNNLNFGEQFIINYKADGNDQQSFDVKTNLPYLFKSPFGIGLELNIFKKDSTFITTNQLAKINYQINPNSGSYIGYKSKESTNLLDNEIVGENLEDYTSQFLIAGASFRKTQRSQLFPLKTNIKVETEIGTRKISNKKENQIHFSILANQIFNLNYRNSIFIQNETSVLKSDIYFTNELLRFGGINSIRGFNENSIFASMFSVLNTEYRYQINEGFYLHSITDLGYFENQSVKLKEKIYSFGFGIGMKTKAGIFKFNLANGNSESQVFNFSNTKIHISLTSQF